MKKIVFTEEFCQPGNLFPFTLTRQVQDIRVGALTIREKWEAWLNMPSFDRFEDDYKDREKAFVIEKEIGNDIIYLIHGNVLPSRKLVKRVKRLNPGEFLSVRDPESLVYCISKKQIVDAHRILAGKGVLLDEPVLEIKTPWDILRYNAEAMMQDIALLQTRRSFQRLPRGVQATGSKNIFIEKGAVVEPCFINAADGPVYISKGATIMAGTAIRGPVFIGEGATVKMNTSIYGATTIGPGCVVGGEVKNSVFFAYSNKAHDGYIGDSVIGEWCNLGAGTSNSNIKNNASPIVVYTPSGPVTVGSKCGVFLADYVRSAINTSLNTGTVVGVAANVFGAGLSPKFIPHFSWGSDGIERYRFDKVLDDIAKWKALKGKELSDGERAILKHIYNHY